MKRSIQIICIVTIIILTSGSPVKAFSGPFDGKNFNGRIAFSSDGNYNDEDDWGAFPVAAAILDAFGVTGKLVHVDYSNILAENDPRFYKEMVESVLGSAERYNISRSILFDCQKDLDGAVESIKNAINASSADNPLYYILAGPMEVPYLGIEKSDPAKRRYVYCISHSRWNDGYTSSDRALHNHNKRDVIPSGINWVQVKDGNRNLAHPGGVGKKSTPEQWRLYHWMRDSQDTRLGWIFTRLEAEQRADISDATMTYFLLTGDEDSDLSKLKRLLDEKKLPAQMDTRNHVRFEAENFLTLDNFTVDQRGDRNASHRLSVRFAGRGRGSISAPFNQPYTAESDSYDIDVRYFNAKEGQCRLVLLVNGTVQGDAWFSSENNDNWATKTIPNVTIKSGDQITVVAQSRRSGYTKLDYVQFNSKVPATVPGQKRIAYSCDGNNRDRDDLFASAVSIAIFGAFKATDKVVHFDYNSILGEDDPEYLKVHEESVRGAAKRFGLSDTVIFNDSTELDAAIDNIKKAVNASSATDPLYFVIAGPMEVPWRGINAADPGKRKYVYCISHTVWNDMFFWDTGNPEIKHNKRDLIELGVNWIQIPGQKDLGTCPEPKHGPCPPEKWALWNWMRDSSNGDVAWLYERLKAMGRPDCSDSGMVYFLLCGNQQPEVEDLRHLLEGYIPPTIDQRTTIRLEAENFHFQNYTIPERRLGAAVSQRLCAQLTSGSGHIRTTFNELYAANGSFDFDVRYFDGKNGRSEFSLFVAGVQRGESWIASADNEAWQSRTVANVPINVGDEIMVKVRADGDEKGRLDYVQLNYRPKAANASGSVKSHIANAGSLDDPDALPGQIIVAGRNPGYLKYNGGGPAFLCGPDNPETFLFMGDLNPDGTRSNGQQQLVIDRLIASGANAFHFQMFRMRRCNIKDEGDDQHCPFVNFDPNTASEGLNDAILDQWDGWISQLEKAGIVIHLEFYNDATDVEMMGWKLDDNGNLHPDEKGFFEGIVKRFKHHKNIIWGIEESLNKLPRSRTPYFMKLSKLIVEVDNHHHPIVHSFVTADTSEGDRHADGVMSDEYISDPHISLVTWLHVLPHGEDYEAQHQAYLHYSRIDSDRFIVMKNETERFPRTEPLSRIYQWSCVMTGMHALEAGHDVVRRQKLLKADGLIAGFMEQTDFHKMKSRDDLATGSTKWVLANPGNSYIAYTYDYSGPMGVKDMTAGKYDLMWFDPVDGDTVTQTGISVSSDNATWNKPDAIEKEVALYIKRQ